MNRRTHATAVLVAVLMLLSFLLTACSEGGESGAEPNSLDTSFERTPPPLNLATFGGENQLANDTGTQNGVLDMTNVSQGYVAVRANASTPGLFRMTNGEQQYTYNMDTGGSDQFFPLAMGDGHYLFEMLIYVEGTDSQYAPLITGEADVALESGFAPFLVNSAIVNYNESSSAVAQSYEVAKHAQTNLEVVQQVYQWVADNIQYDYDLAAEVNDGTPYVPDLERIMSEKKGICYDYASLVAAMLRANAIPCQLVMGNVNTGEGGVIYHAWNLVWLEEEGWIALEIPAVQGDWSQIDLTFAASGGDEAAAQYIGDGSRYAQTSTH